MSEPGKKRRGPVAVFIDWFMVDPVTTGLVMIPPVVFGCIVACRAIYDALAGWL